MTALAVALAVATVAWAIRDGAPGRDLGRLLAALDVIEGSS